MKSDNDISQQLAETVRAAAAARTPIAIHGSGSKRFLTGDIQGTPIDVTGHRDIISYEPTELVLTARAGADEAKLRSILLNEFNLEIGAGLGALAGKIVRIGLMGHAAFCLAALEAAVAQARSAAPVAARA